VFHGTLFKTPILILLAQIIGLRAAKQALALFNFHHQQQQQQQQQQPKEILMVQWSVVDACDVSAGALPRICRPAPIPPPPPPLLMTLASAQAWPSSATWLTSPSCPATLLS
jgi:hypothetical protein